MDVFFLLMSRRTVAAVADHHQTTSAFTSISRRPNGTGNEVDKDGQRKNDQGEKKGENDAPDEKKVAQVMATVLPSNVSGALED